MDKVKISKELASAIETVKEKGFYDNKNFEILEMATTQPKDDSIMRAQHEVIYLYCHHDGIDILMSALVNGYEVEETPEDKVREYYNKHLGWIQQARDANDEKREESLIFAKIAIEETVFLLGIKIEGVNA